jgi:hypothetical protein
MTVEKPLVAAMLGCIGCLVAGQGVDHRTST